MSERTTEKQSYSKVYDEAQGKDVVAYSYLHENGELFVCQGDTLDACIKKRNRWILEQNNVPVFKVPAVDMDRARRAASDKLFITEILNDLNRYGYVEGGKADTMLRDWAAELREIARPVIKSTPLRRYHADHCGAENW